MSLNNANHPVSVVVGLGTVAASAIHPAIYLPRRSALKSVSIMNGAALPHDATNFARCKLQDNNGGGSPIDLASFDGSLPQVTPGDGKGDLAADIAFPLVSLVAPQAGSQGGFPPSVGYPIDVAAGKSLQANIVIGGTGSLTNAKLIIDYYPL